MDSKVVIVTSATVAALVAAYSFAFHRGDVAGSAPSPAASRSHEGAVYRTTVRFDPEVWTKEKKAAKPAEDANKTANELYDQGRFAESFVAAKQAVALARPWQRGLFVEDARRLQGRDLVDMGQYRRAILYLTQNYRVGQSEALDLDLALCFLKLGDVAGARRHFSDRLILRDDPRLTPKDLPGTSSPKGLEASIRLARGIELAGTTRHELAAVEFARAESLSPNNAYIALSRGLSLQRANRHDLAQASLLKAARLAKGTLRWTARSQLDHAPPEEGIPGWSSKAGPTDGPDLRSFPIPPSSAPAPVRAPPARPGSR